jgi:hypothetical protein
MLTFIISPTARTVPTDPSLFAGTFEGKAKILESAQFPDLVSKEVSVSIKSIVSCSSAFVYQVGTVVRKRDRIYINARSPVYALRLKNMLTMADVQLACSEITESQEMRSRAKLAAEGAMQRNMARIMADYQITPEALLANGVAGPLLKRFSDMHRLFLIQDILQCTSQRGEKQRARVRALTTVELESVHALLKSEPWLLAFKHTVRSMLNVKLEAMNQDGFKLACEKFKISVPRTVQLAMAAYFYYKTEQDERHSTYFYWGQNLGGLIPIMERREQEPLVRSFLVEHAIQWLDDREFSFAFNVDFEYASEICDALKATFKRARKHRPALRGLTVIKQPPTLTVREGSFPSGLTFAHDARRVTGLSQLEVAAYILQHAVTMVEGLPGTGKTALIEWAANYFAYPFLCTLTGMMTKSLQYRNGKRPEVAHTIDSAVYAARFDKGARKWLREFDVLIIDEFSNTDTKRVAQLLRLMPKLVRIILVGDHQQIRSIGAGDAMGDFRSTFTPIQELTTNLRVDERLKPLFEAPRLIVSRKHKSLGWNPQGPLSLVPKSGDDLMATLRPLILDVFALRRALMSFHIVVLQNDIRRRINGVVQELVIESDLIDTKGGSIKLGDTTFYVGSKITFTKNYNKELMHKVGKRILRSWTVANGDLGVVTKIERLENNIIYITFVDNDYDMKEAVTKSVICSRAIEGAIDPFHIDLGYASTTTKIQGREAPYVIFWNNDRPSEYWTRSHAYVAVSRGKQHVWVVSTLPDFYRICENPDKHRRTALYVMLTQKKELGIFSDEGTLHASPDLLFKPLVQYVPLLPGIPCVPRKEEFLKLEELQEEPRAPKKKIKVE